jgi:hypothetical protein
MQNAWPGQAAIRSEGGVGLEGDQKTFDRISNRCSGFEGGLDCEGELRTYKAWRKRMPFEDWYDQVRVEYETAQQRLQQHCNAPAPLPEHNTAQRDWSP